MFTKMVLLACGLFVSICVFAQQKVPAVIAPAGGVNKTAKIFLEWTVGEPVIESISSPFLLVTQGFHQPLLGDIDRLIIAVPQAERITLMVFPNPVQTLCKAFVERQGDAELFLELSDINGRSLYLTRSTSKTEVIDFDLTPYASGIYILSVRDASGGLYQTHKIIKAQ